MAKDTVYFISDAHLGLNWPGAEGREAAMAGFLREIGSRAASLYILGDLFDFWVEYRSSIRRDYFPVLHALRSLVEGGTTIHYLRGNHDFAVATFLPETIGIDVRTGPWRLTLQGKRLFLLHGDGVRSTESGYRFLDRLLRNRWFQKAYKLLHPSFGIWLGEAISGFSRTNFTIPVTEELLEEYRRIARGYLEEGNDIVVFGHTHSPEIRRLGGGIYCNTGAWLKEYSFATLEAGEITLWHYLPGRPSQPVSPV